MTNRILVLQDGIVKSYRDDKIPMKVIANNLNINLKTVIKILKLNNVEIRNGKKNMLGNRYGKLSVIQFTRKDKSGKLMWGCQCDCGNKTEVRGGDLMSKKVKSCGCIYLITSAENIKQAHKLYPRSWGFCGIGDIQGSYFSGTKHSAMDRNLEYSVTKEYLWELFLKQNRKCAMTGIEIGFRKKHEPRQSQTASLDRIDSKKGYTEGNVQWLHKDINNMKQDYTVDEFKNYCRLVVQHNQT